MFTFLFFNYLGLYGIFICIFIPASLCWFSIIPFINLIFFDSSFFYINFGKWIFLNTNTTVQFDFFVDGISLSFSFLTLSISCFTLVYTFSYFRYEPSIERLFIFLSFFILSMIFLVSTNNLINFFLGWELIGLTSFILINFWSTKVSTLKSAFKAYTFNKLSDVFLLFAIILIFSLTFNLDIVSFLQNISIYNNYFLTFIFLKISFIDTIAFCFVISAFIKSAQFGMHIWLPDSMEAPVPASALIHSATLVSAGIFVLLRFSSIFDNSYLIMSQIAIIGSLTAFYGGFVSMNQFDTKKILAYSTISHCGFLMVVFSTGIVEYTLTYLYIHGFFKASIFMCVGNINRFNKNNQDIRKMGGLFKYLPFEVILTLIGIFNLGGLPFSLGFYIKHLIFLGLNTNLFIFYFVFINCLLAAVTGIYYSYRLVYFIFFDFKKNKSKAYTSFSVLNFNSIYLSNSNKAGILSIFGLFSIAYIFGIYFLIIYLSNNFSFFDNFSILNYSMQFLHSSNIKTLGSNFQIINFFLVINMFILILSNWRLLVIRRGKVFYYFLFFLFFF